MEPANYPKLLDLIRIYLNAGDADSAARVLSMSSEYLLAAGQGDECNKWITEILERDPLHIGALRLLVRYCSWIKDESAYSVALVRLADAAKKLGSAEDERFALSHLVVTRPFETDYSLRLDEINLKNGFVPEPVDAELLRAQFKNIEPTSFRQDDSLRSVVEHVEHNGFHTAVDLERFDRLDLDTPTTDSKTDFAFTPAGVAELSEFDEIVDAEEAVDVNGHNDEQRFRKEIESIEFYVENDYHELAEKAIAELAAEFGTRPEIDELDNRLHCAVSEIVAAHSLGIDEIRSEFGLDDNEPAGESDDYETRYQMAVAYQEMGLMEQAIKEYQDAINLVSPRDGTRRFFQCANLMGHCFLNSGMANLAVTWYSRALETPGLNDDETQGLWYELALAYTAEGNHENAGKYFERIYAENVDFRDVSERVRQLIAAE
jgi:tetratricopeptide (TPR) repeat protein